MKRILTFLLTAIAPFALYAQPSMDGSSPVSESLLTVEEKLAWNDTEYAFEVTTGIEDVVQTLGQEVFKRVRNSTGATITNGSVVRVEGATGNRPNVVLAQADTLDNLKGLLGVATHDIGNNEDGFITIVGFVNELDTSGFSEGDGLYVSDTTAGLFTNVEPAFSYKIGTVLTVNPSQGRIDVNTQDNASKVFMEANASAARLYGGVITSNGDGTIAVTAGAGLIKEDEAGPEEIPTALGEGQASGVTYVDWGAVASLALTDNAYNYIYYDGPTDTITTTTDFYTISFTRDFVIGRAFRSGTDVVVRLCGTSAWNFDRRVQLFGEEVFPIKRGTGLVTSETGTRNIAITAGVLWAELVNRFSIDAFDSSASDTFSYWYQDGAGGWTEVTGQAQIDNLNYDDGSGTPAALTNTWYGVRWVYVMHDGSVHVVLGETNGILTIAEAASSPSTLPSILSAYATLSAKIIIQKSASSFAEIQSAFTQSFTVGSIADQAKWSAASRNWLRWLNETGYFEVESTGIFSGDAPVVFGTDDISIAWITQADFDTNSGTILFASAYDGGLANSAFWVQRYDSDSISVFYKTDTGTQYGLNVSIPEMVNDRPYLCVFRWDKSDGIYFSHFDLTDLATPGSGYTAAVATTSFNRSTGNYLWNASVSSSAIFRPLFCVSSMLTDAEVLTYVETMQLPDTAEDSELLAFQNPTNNVRLYSNKGISADIINAELYPLQREDTITDGVILAEHYGAIGDGTTDDTSAIQAALDAANTAGGGVVRLDVGQYLVSTYLNIPADVTLEGVWSAPTSYNWTRGTVLLATYTTGGASGTPFITMNGNSALKGITIYYPNQSATSVVAYPWTIRSNTSADGVSILNCTITNPYQAVDMATNESGRHLIDGLYGQPLLTGIKISRCFDVARFNNIHFWPFWNATDALTYTKANGTGIEILRSDWQQISNSFVFGYYKGFSFDADAYGEPSAILNNVGADACHYAVYIDASTEYGILINNGEFVATSGTNPVTVKITSNVDPGEVVSFSNSAFWGACYRNVETDGGDIRFIGCTFRDFSDYGIVAGADNLIVSGSNFTTSGNCVYIENTMTGAVVTGNIGINTATELTDNLGGSATAIANNVP